MLAMHFDPTFLHDNPQALRRRIERFAARVSLVQRRRTHIVQNSRHAIEIVSGFVSCVNEHISMLRLPASAVVNIYETNIDFNMHDSTTLERRGVRAVTVRATAFFATDQ
jgi:hypothetical protein